MESELKKFTVVEAFELSPAVEVVEAKEAVVAEVGTVVELSAERAAELGEKVTPVEEV